MDFALIDWLRILCGVWFIPHLIGKALHYERAGGTFEAAGLKPGKLFVGVAIVAEACAAVGLIFSIYPQVAALFGALVLLGSGLCGRENQRHELALAEDGSRVSNILGPRLSANGSCVITSFWGTRRCLDTQETDFANGTTDT